MKHFSGAKVFEAAKRKFVKNTCRNQHQIVIAFSNDSALGPGNRKLLILDVSIHSQTTENVIELSSPAEVTVIAFHYEYDRNVPSQALVRSSEIKSDPQILA